MSSNSGREQIIIYHLNILKKIGGIKVVDRTQKSLADLKNYSSVQFPIAAVVAGLPKPKEKFSQRSVASVDKIRSTLRIGTIIYLMARENTDKLVSEVADDLWRKLYEDPTRGDLVIKTTLNFPDEPQAWDPYLAFKIDVLHEYIHTTGGI